MGLGVKVLIFVGGSLAGGMLSTLLLLACWRCCASKKTAIGGATGSVGNVVVGVPAHVAVDLESNPNAA